MRWLWYLAAACLLLQGCGGSEDSAADPSSAAACSIADQRVTLRDFMEREYYWYKHLAPANESVDTLDEYFRSMLYKPVDRYSFAEPTAVFNQLFFDGRRTGYGYSLVYADATLTSARVRNVEPLSPVARAGLKRGDTIIWIDGFSPAEIAAGALPLVNTPGVTRRFFVRDSAGHQRVITVESEDFPLSPLAEVSTFDVVRDGRPVKVGYLAYHQFAGYTWQPVRQAFARLRDEGAAELILDLRYNGGGSVTLARDVASLIASQRGSGTMFAHLRYNDKRPGNGIELKFNLAATPDGVPGPGFDRLVVIGSGATASASELLINGLRPIMDVVLVGETTYGKPYGFTPRSYCGLTYNAVQFEAFNALGVADYASGFAPRCEVPDDLDRPLGDAGEGRIRAALDYIVTGSCAQAPRSFAAPLTRRPPAFGEIAPNRMFIEEP